MDFTHHTTTGVPRGTDLEGNGDGPGKGSAYHCVVYPFTERLRGNANDRAGGNFVFKPLKLQ